MTDLKIFSKLLLKYILLLVFYIILIIFLFGLSINYIYHEDSIYISSPREISYKIIGDDIENLSKTNLELLDKNNIWLLVLDENGRYKNSYKSPENLNRNYSVKEIVKFTRWYLDDYPVFTFIDENNILVFGYPKDSYGKLANNYFKVDGTFLLAYISTGIVLIVITSIFLIYYFSNKKLIKEIGSISEAILRLSENKRVNLENTGELKNIKIALNKTSNNLNLARKEGENWLKGISHDIRTPLTIISGYVNVLENTSENSKEINIINDQIEKIKNIIEGFNLTYMIENMTNLENQELINFKKLLRDISINFFNNTSKKFSIELEDFENPSFLGNKNLLDRAFRNIILNSIEHNDEVEIKIRVEENNNVISLTIEDNGKIKKEKVEELKTKKSTVGNHGFGILVVKKIIFLHQGKVNFMYNNPGLKTIIRLKK